MRNIRIGDYLVEEGHITPEQLQQVLQKQHESPDQKRFGDVVVELGFMTDVKFAQALSGKLKVPYVDLNSVEVDGESHVRSRRIWQKRTVSLQSI